MKKGNKRTNSTSKIKNSRVIKKNRIEKGNRALSLLENPHSKGLNLFRSWKVFCDKTNASRPTILARAVITNQLKSNISIKKQT